MDDSTTADETIVKGGPVGWRCPVCGRVNAPWITVCPCSTGCWPPYRPPCPCPVKPPYPDPGPWVCIDSPMVYWGNTWGNESWD